MLENKFRISTLFIAHLRGTLTPDQQSELDKWLGYNAENRRFFDEFCQEQQITSGLKTYHTIDRKLVWNKISTKINQAKAAKIKKRKKRILWYKIAAACLLLMVGTALVLHHTTPPVPSPPIVNSSIKPGNVSATLTLADGRTIILSDDKDGEIAQDAGIHITKTKDGKIIYRITSDEQATTPHAFNTLTTTRGQTYQIILPDGTKVWLNAASSLQYPVRFTGPKRQVELTGEAYFEVAKNKKNPFIVRSGIQETEVLGTRFNINCYPDEEFVKTTLLEGAVRILPIGKSKATLLSPGQESNVSKERLFVKNIDPEAAIAWKNGDFSFENEDFETAMRKIARWYNVEVSYKTPASTYLLPGGWISRNKDLAAVLEIMSATGSVHFSIQGRKVLVIPSR